MSNSENMNATDFKTRVLIYSDSSAPAAFIRQIQDLNDKPANWLENEEGNSSGSDFLVLQTSDSVQAAEFRPTIVFVSSANSAVNIEQIISQITPGGVLVYPENMSDAVQNSSNYFRRIPFAPANINAEAGAFYLVTEMGDLPLNNVDDIVRQDMDGIKLFCAQFGVMEEEFYSTVSEL